MVHGDQAFSGAMLKSVREASGMGHPLDTFYTNNVESVTCIIKHKINYKTCEWSDFCKLARELVEEQEIEIEKADIGFGE